MASETPEACAISLVVVPRNPLSEKRDMATARIWRRLSSPAIRTPLMLGEVSLLTVIGLLNWLRPWKNPSQSKYLLTIQGVAMSSKEEFVDLIYVGASLLGRTESPKRAPTE